MAIEPIRSQQVAAPDAAAEAAKSAESVEKVSQKKSKFGPAYKIDEALASKPADLRVPFSSASPGRTLSDLPPINPIGTERLTKLSLQSMIETPRKKT